MTPTVQNWKNTYIIKDDTLAVDAHNWIKSEIQKKQEQQNWCYVMTVKKVGLLTVSYLIIELETTKIVSI